jgi:hypothetical protein
VEVELEERWKRDFRKLLGSAGAEVEKLKRFATTFDSEAACARFPTEGNALTTYREQVAAAKSRLLIETTPLVAPSVEKLFGLASRYHPPFVETDRGFKDAVILFSVLEDLKLQPEPKSGMLISADRIFQDPGIAELGKEAGVTLGVFKDLHTGG